MKFGLRSRTGIFGKTSGVTQPASTSAATSARPAASDRSINPWVRLPTLQLPWSSGTVVKVLSAPFIQKTQPAGTLPVRPSDVGSGMLSSYVCTPSGAVLEKVIAKGDDSRFNNDVS